MKTILKTTMLMVILGIAFRVHAAPVNQNYEDVIKEFIGGYINTDYKKMKAVLRYDVYQKIPREKMVYKHQYVDILKGMKNTGTTVHNSTWDYKVLAQGEAMILAQINYYYENHIISDFITLERDTQMNWKVTSINKFFAPTSPSTVLSVN